MGKDVSKKKFSPMRIVLFLLVFSLIIFSYYLTSTFKYDETIQLDGSFSIFGWEIEFVESSLLLAAIVIGFVDGFNPCAMWVLIYLITLVSSLEDKRKMYYIVGTFVVTEAIMYFMILAGWLELLKFIGISQWLLYGVGGFALWFGFKSVYSFIQSGGQVVCEVGDFESRKKTMNKIKTIATSPITVASVIGTILLAIAVNSIEFVCSAGLPAVFSQMLVISGVSNFMKYVYILVYDLFFMIDDFIIFGLALFAINSPILDKYAGLSKLLGGIIMILIGIMLLFFPGLLV